MAVELLRIGVANHLIHHHLIVAHLLITAVLHPTIVQVSLIIVHRIAGALAPIVAHLVVETSKNVYNAKEFGSACNFSTATTSSSKYRSGSYSSPAFEFVCL